MTMTLKHNFDEIVDRRGTNSSKWLKYPADVLPMWIADSSAARSRSWMK